MLWRLLADVKQRFDLARNVPNEAERLSWELPRFLDLAARKGRLVIVIDGLHRLQDKNGDNKQTRGRRADNPFSELHTQMVGENYLKPLWDMFATMATVVLKCFKCCALSKMTVTRSDTMHAYQVLLT